MSIPHVPPPLTHAQYNKLIDGYNGFIPSGTFRSPYAYLVDTDGTDWYAANSYQVVYGGPSDTGGVDGGDPVAVLQAAIDNLTAGRSVKETVVVKGAMTVDASITIPSYTILDLLEAKFTADASLDADMLSINTSAVKVELLGGWLEGNSANNASGNGIRGNSSTSEVYIDGMKIRDFKESGIYVGTASTGVYWITRNYITSNTLHGIQTSAFSDSVIVGNDIGANGYNGIYMGSSGGNKISSNGLWTNSQNGGNAACYLYECRDITFGNNWLHDNYRNGFQVHGTSAGYNVRNAVVGNVFRDNGALAGNTYYDCVLSGTVTQQNSVIGNTFYSPDVKYNVFLTGTDPYPTNNTIVGNTCVSGGYTTQSMAATGTFTGNVVRSNVGYVTENCGKATIANGDTFVDVTHGLAATPTSIGWAGTHQEVETITITNVGAATFRITTTVGATTGNRDVYWSAKYWP